MTSVEQTPSPAAVVTDDGHARAMDDALDELAASADALRTLASATRDPASREILRGVLESLAEAKGYLTGEAVEDAAELDAVDDEIAVDTAAPDDSITAAATAAGQPASAIALNGAQVQAAQGIITSVAKGELPRATGVEMLVQFFSMSPVAADALMGTVGGTFTLAAPEVV